jgi:hypothetical protein
VKTTAAMLIVLICSIPAIASSGSSAEQPGTLTGRFVAQVDGPPLTSFGANHEFYIFKIESYPDPQFAILSYSFFLYQPQLPRRVFDYSRLYSFPAAGDQRCAQTIEEVAKRFVFDASGQFIEIKNAITYSKNVPPLTFSWKKSLPCYVLSPQSVRAIE